VSAVRWQDMYIAAVGSWVPAPSPARDAVEAGLLDPERFKQLGYESLCVADDVAPPDMAARAGETALARSGLTSRDFRMLLHGSLWFQGLDIWPAGSYVAARTVGRGVPALDVQQRCNVGLGAVELAASVLHAAGSGAAMVTTADRFAPPAVDRWNMHDFNLYGDGGTALILSTKGGFARLLSTATVSDNALEGQARGDEPFAAASPAAVAPIDLMARADQYAATADPVQTSVRIGRVMLLARNKALTAAGVNIGRVARVVTPASGRLKGDYQMHDLLDVPAERTTWDFGRTTGHIGAGDWALGLEHLVRTRAVAPGDTVLLFGGGAGYTCTAAVVEILDVPELS
jgi:3-oxoacyl-[acyl-carrier-protein] synthase-3